MKWLVVLSTFVGATLAQDCAAVALESIPSCAQSCFLNSAPSIGCAQLDFACQCNNQAALFAAAEADRTRLLAAGRTHWVVHTRSPVIGRKRLEERHSVGGVRGTSS